MSFDVRLKKLEKYVGNPLDIDTDYTMCIVPDGENTYSKTIKGEEVVITANEYNAAVTKAFNSINKPTLNVILVNDN